MDGRPTRVLVVDDDAVDRLSVRRALWGSRSAQDPVEIVEAETGAEALEQLAAGRFDCIFLDFRLPDFDGLELLTRLQESGVPDGTPVVMLTGAGNLETAVAAMRQGARDYLVKQSDYQALIPSVLRRVEAEQSLHRRQRLAEEGLRLHREGLQELVQARTAELQRANQRLEADLRVRRRVERSLHAEKQRALVTLRSISDAVITTDAAGRVETLNPAAERLLGVPAHDARGRPLAQCLPLRFEGDDSPVDLMTLIRAEAPQCGYYILPRAGGDAVLAASPAAIHDPEGAVSGLVVVLRDVTEERRLSSQWAHAARHDALTGLVNRAEFERRLAHAQESVRHQRAEHVLCYLDLDGFKQVNDCGGHAAGDALLRQIAQRLAAVVRQRDVLARLGGDEFACLFEHCALSEGRQLAAQLLATVGETELVWEGAVYRVGVSLGVASMSDPSLDPAELMARADSACYRAKAAGRNRVEVWEDSGAAAPPPVLAQLRQAMADDELALFAQPIAALGETDAPAYYEILVRVPSPSGWLPAGEFIAAAQRHHLGLQLDRWVLRAALAHIARQEDTEAIHYLNLCCDSLEDPHFLEFLADQLSVHGVAGRRLGFEIPESMLVERRAQVERFAAGLRAPGCALALDDFSGNLALMPLLQALRPQLVKIRPDLVQALGQDGLASLLVEAINRVSHAVAIRTVAKWPGSASSLRLLQDLGTDRVQGDLVRPAFPLQERIDGGALHH